MADEARTLADYEITIRANVAELAMLVTGAAQDEARALGRMTIDLLDAYRNNLLSVGLSIGLHAKANHLTIESLDDLPPEADQPVSDEDMQLGTQLYLTRHPRVRS
jgi:hypothetical protein